MGRKRTQLRVADLFCGAGGFSEGFRQMGFDVVYALDNWKPAVEAHRLNHPECETVLGDVLTIGPAPSSDDGYRAKPDNSPAISGLLIRLGVQSTPARGVRSRG